MELTYVGIPSVYADELDNFVESGEFASRNEAVRTAVRDFLIARGIRKASSLKKTVEVET